MAKIDDKSVIVKDEIEDINLIERKLEIPYYRYFITLPKNYLYIYDDNSKAGLFYYIFPNNIDVYNIDDLYNNKLLDKMYGVIYFGFHPRTIDNQYELIETIELKLLDQNVKWNIYKKDIKYYTYITIKIGWQYMGIFGQGNNKENIMELINIFSTITKE
jgi:hypothetical protein